MSTEVEREWIRDLLREVETEASNGKRVEIRRQHPMVRAHLARQVDDPGAVGNVDAEGLSVHTQKRSAARPTGANDDNDRHQGAKL